MKKNVLMISTDRGMLSPDSSVAKRHAGYAGFADSLHIVVFSLKKIHSKERIKLAENVFIYPTASWFKVLYLLDSLILGLRITFKEKINFVVAQNAFETGVIGYMISKIKKTPIQIQMHTDPFSENFINGNPGLLGKLRRMSTKFLLPRASSIRVVSQRIKTGVEKFLSGKKLPPIIILPIYANVKKIMESVPQFSLKEKYPQFDKILLTLSRLEPEKNIFMAIDALKIILQKFPKVGLVIVGVGSQKKGLENKIKELELNENVVIWNEYLHAPSAMKTVDIFLLTSDFEGFALTLVESAASGTPIVSTDVGLVGGVLFPEEDILVSQVRDVKTFAEQIERILSDENLREKLVKNALNAVQTRVLQNEQDYLEAYKNSWK